MKKILSTVFGVIAFMAIQAQSVPGTATGANTVCDGSNSGTINLNGYVGSIVRWEQSPTGSAPWASITNTTNALTYANLNSTMFYRAIVQTATFTPSPSNAVKITVKDSSIAGSITGASNVCAGTSGEVLTLGTGTGDVVKWEFSTNNGATWATISNTTNTYTLGTLSTQTQFRAQVQNAPCAAVYSMPHTVSIDALSNAGSITGADTVCETSNSATVEVNNFTGTVQNWETASSYSGPWSTVAVTDSTLNLSNLPNDTYFRTKIKNGVCGAVYNTPILIKVDEETETGILSGTASVCDDGNSGDVTYLGGNASSNIWQYSMDQTNFVDTNVSGSVLTYNNLTETTTYRIKAKNGVCATEYSNPITISVNPTPTALFSTDSVCVGALNSYTDLSSVASGSLTYSWSFGDGTGVSMSNPTHQYGAAGSYNTTLQVTTNKGCTDSYSAVAGVYSKPNPGFTFNSECDDTPITFTSSTTINGGSIAYAIWDFGEANASDTANLTQHLYNQPGFYTVKLKTISNKGCVDSTTNTVEVYPNPVVAFVKQNVCEGTAVQFQNQTTIGSGNMNYNWDFGDFTSSSLASPTRNYADTGNYMVVLTATSTFGCTDSDSKMVRVNEVPQPNFTATEECDANTTVFTNLNAYQSSDTLSYTWTFGDGNNSTDKNPMHLFNAPGTYNVKLAVLSDSGCYNEVTKPVKVFAVPTANFTASPACLGDSNAFTNLSSISNGTLNYIWSFGDSVSSTMISPNHLYGEAGIFTATLIANAGSSGCADTISKSVLVNNNPTASFSFDNECDISPISFVNNSTANNGSITSNVWDFGDGTNSVQVNPVKEYLNHGEYQVKLTVTTSEGCVHDTSAIAKVYPGPVANFSVEPVCFGTASEMINSSSITSGQLTYAWTFNETGASSVENPEYTFQSAGAYPVKLVVTSDFGCQDSITRMAGVLNYAKVVAPSDTTISKGYGVQLTAYGADTYVWSPALSLSSEGGNTVYATPTETTTYVIQAIDSFGCNGSDSVTVNVVEDFILIPSNLITPNGDGQNDVWKVENMHAYDADVSLTILDRWGNVVYETDNYQNDWNASNQNGDWLPDGSYFYVLDFTTTDRIYKGSITVLRNE